MPTASQAAAGASFVVFAAAAAWLVLSEFPVPDPGRPTAKVPGMQVLEAAVPAIGDFASFNVNKQNPFIPYDLRMHDIPLIDRPRPSPKQTPRGPSPIVPDKPQLPRLTPPGQTGPAATGIVISKDGPQALLTFPGETRGQLLKPGESANGWTLVEVIDGNIASVRQDATGSILDLVVPESLDRRTAEVPAKDRDGNRKDADHTPENGRKTGKKSGHDRQSTPEPGPPPAIEPKAKPAQPATVPAEAPAVPLPEKLM